MMRRSATLSSRLASLKSLSSNCWTAILLKAIRSWCWGIMIEASKLKRWEDVVLLLIPKRQNAKPVLFTGEIGKWAVYSAMMDAKVVCSRLFLGLRDSTQRITSLEIDVLRHSFLRSQSEIPLRDAGWRQKTKQNCRTGPNTTVILLGWRWLPSQRLTTYRRISTFFVVDQESKYAKSRST